MFKEILFLISFLIIQLAFIGCSSTAHKTTTPDLSTAEYYKVIKKQTRKDEKYSGLNNQYIIHITFLKPEVQTAQNLRLKNYLQWDDKTS